MDEKLRFVHLANSGRFHISDLCLDFGISRKTGHKYLSRYAEHGTAGLKELSRRPNSSPCATGKSVERIILKLRREHSTWGPKKIRHLLATRHGIESPPALSTIGDILKRNGLIKSKRRKPGVYRVANEELTVPEQPNDVWTVDYKGWFLLGDGQRCDPLTVCDLCTHFILGCRARPNQQHIGTHKEFKGLMRHHGVPRCNKSGQRISLRLRRHRRTFQAERVVDRAGHTRGVHQAGMPARQWLSRANAS